MVELTPLVEEEANLWSWAAKASRDANEADKAFKALSARSWKDDEEATRVRKERDELLQKDAKTCQRILVLLGKVEKEKERDEQIQTTERHCSECGVAHEERNQAFQERDWAYHEHDDAQ